MDGKSWQELSAEHEEWVKQKEAGDLLMLVVFFLGLGFLGFLVWI